MKNTQARKDFRFKNLFSFPQAIQKVVKKVFVSVRVGKLVSVCPGKRHAWYESNVGLVRKPIQ